MSAIEISKGNELDFSVAWQPAEDNPSVIFYGYNLSMQIMVHTPEQANEMAAALTHAATALINWAGEQPENELSTDQVLH